jgi:hypothetical protein
MKTKVRSKRWPQDFIKPNMQMPSASKGEGRKYKRSELKGKVSCQNFHDAVWDAWRSLAPDEALGLASSHVTIANMQGVSAKTRV